MSPEKGNESQSLEDEAGRRVGVDDDPHGFLEGVRAFCEEDYKSALRRFQKLLLSSPHNARYLAACGHCNLLLEDKTKAREYYRRAEGQGFFLGDVIYNQAMIDLQAGETHLAIPRLRALLSGPPHIQKGSFYLGLYFDSRDEFLCDVALHLGQIFFDSGNVPEARKYYLQASELQDDNVTALQRLGELAILSKNYIDAIRFFTEVLEKSPLEEDWINAHNNLGIACYENGDIDEAVSNLTWVLHRSPANPSAVHNLNFIYEKEGIFRHEGRNIRAIKFMDVEEGALPIFELSNRSEASEPDALTIIGRSSEMLRVMRHARVAAASDSSVLIRGENGTGKELLAQLIALNSARRDAPFDIVNCSSMPEVLLESELFGHEKGAFTGARSRKQGALERAEGGTVFLDDIASLTPMLQGRLYRALQEAKFTPVGASQPVPFNVRLICATPRDLPVLMKEGTFREDLFYLINVIGIDLPPLRDRREDIPLLVDFFLQKHPRAGEKELKFSEDDLRILMAYDWPGNVRELENLVERAIVLGSKSSLYLEELARLRRSQTGSNNRHSRRLSESVNYPLQTSLADLEKSHILAVLESVGNNQRQAAKLLGINPSTLWRKLRTYGLEEKGAP